MPLEKQIQNLFNSKNITKLKLDNGKTLEDTLKSEARRLIKILKEEIQERVYNQPESQWYQRTGDLLNSVDETVVIDPKTNTITIGFIDEKAWHDSAITKYRDSGYTFKGYIPLLVNEGFHTLDTSGERWVKSSNWYEGVGFLESAVRRFQQDAVPGITIELIKPDVWS